MTRVGPTIVAITVLLIAGCASIPATSLIPSEAVAQQGAGILWWEESVADPNVLETVPPQFAANAEHLAQARQAFDALAVHFPECPAPSSLGYATWTRPDQLLILFELRRNPGCPTSPLVSLDDAGDVLIIVAPDQPRAFN